VHHNTGSMWMFNTFKKISKRLNIVMNPPSASSLNFEDRLSEHKKIIMFNFHSSFRSEMLRRQDVTGIHLIRDPRDVLVSGMSYHSRHKPKNYSKEPFLHSVREDFNNLTYQQYLNSLPDQFSKYKFEMFNKHRETLKEMCDWDYTNPSVFEWKYEDLIIDEKCRMFTEAMEQFGLTQDELKVAVDCFWENSLFGGMALSTTSGQQHIQSGRKERWKTELPVDVQNLYQQEFGNDLLYLKYETSHHWVNEM
jgi:hypothetical protein